MNFGNEPEKEAQIIYKGSPNSPDAQGEGPTWRRFLGLLGGWFRRKRDLGDDYLEAKVMNQRATAIKTLSEAAKNIAEAKKIATETAQIAAKLDQGNARNIDVIPMPPSITTDEIERALKSDLERLEQKLNETRMLYGTRIMQLEDSPVSEQES